MAADNELEGQDPAVWTVRQGQFVAAVSLQGYEVNGQNQGFVLNMGTAQLAFTNPNN